MPEGVGAGEIAALVAALALSGAIAGTLAGLFGVGGGAVIVPVFYQAFRMLGVSDAVAMHVAIGTSLAIIIPTSLRSFASHRARGAVDMELWKTLIVPVPAGVMLASMVAAYVSGPQLRGIFAAIALLVALKLLLARRDWRIGADIPRGPVRWVAGVLIGLLSSLIGVGGGIMNNTFMTLYGRPIRQAVATSSGVGVLISIPGLFGFVWAGWGEPGLPPFSLGFVNVLGVALVIPISTLMAPVGVAMAHRLTQRQMEVSFGLFVLAISVRFLLSLVLS